MDLPFAKLHIVETVRPRKVEAHVIVNGETIATLPIRSYKIDGSAAVLPLLTVNVMAYEVDVRSMDPTTD